MTRLLTALSLVLLCSCESARKLVKAKPAALSPFLEHRQEMQRRPATEAFQYVWFSPDRAAQNKARPLTSLYVAPVSLEHLRPVKTGKLRYSERRGTHVSAEAPALGAELRRSFTTALRAAGRYRAATQPGPRTLVLELAFTELNPTNPAMNAAKLAAKIAFGPVGSIGGLAVRSSGNVAIEGRLRAGARGPVVMEFADNEKDKMTFYSVRDFRPYGHVRMSIQEWSRQFAQWMQGGKFRDASFWTLSPL